ncbi:MAG: UDP-3-O-[3-hydroxymyristoyl] glucosamine N-acyltransferase LpxD [Phormidesmis priestleyi Ana]|uniref:UDP-3-O-acylglucosamine N-acyltransferase n=1 Tax=Phormidesmis priestleyi Ana TaxID=1666911 RepID=A0A0P7YUI8_9CYAN|nr:MAG: UDP-3-O-[3-hydroxymyristoyl] glucosamine N-acyltransferase LpxD [Phormidesmis priestleyi Ana]
MKFSQIIAALGDEVTGCSLDEGSLDEGSLDEGSLDEGSGATSAVGGELELTELAAIQSATKTALSYVEGPKFAEYIETTQAGALILPPDEAIQQKAQARSIPWISVKNPRLVFARAIALFYKPYRQPPGIHPTAVVDPSACIGENVAIGPNAVIQPNVRIGDQVCIHPNVVVYPGAIIGSNTELHACCVIHERSHIGENCIIHSGAVIGSEGFGFVPTAEGWEKMNQSGIVVIEDGVEIGCNTTVDRPAVGETRVGRNTKIDNLVHIAHGCTIGEAVAMAAQVGIAGGVTVGKRVILAGQVGIANQANIGDGAIASAKAGIHHDVPAGETVSGMPAIPHKVYLRAAILFRRLPEMAKAIKDLQKAMAENPPLKGSSKE